MSAHPTGSERRLANSIGWTAVCLAIASMAALFALDRMSREDRGEGEAGAPAGSAVQDGRGAPGADAGAAGEAERPAPAPADANDAPAAEQLLLKRPSAGGAGSAGSPAVESVGGSSLTPTGPSPSGARIPPQDPPRL